MKTIKKFIGRKHTINTQETMERTGVRVNRDALNQYEEFKHLIKHRYLLFSFNETFSEIIITRAGDRSESYESLVESLPLNSCGYIVYDLEYEENGIRKSKFILLLWAPDAATLKSKMLYAGSCATLQKSLGNIDMRVQGCERKELDFDELLTRVGPNAQPVPDPRDLYSFVDNLKLSLNAPITKKQDVCFQFQD
jgi:cofilin